MKLPRPTQRYNFVTPYTNAHEARLARRLLDTQHLHARNYARQS